MNTLVLNGGPLNGSAVVVETPLPPDLLSAVEQAFRGGPLVAGQEPPTSGLSEVFGEELVEVEAGKWDGIKVRRNRARPGDRMPYLLLDEEPYGENQPTFRGLVIRRSRVTLSAYANSEVAASGLGRLIRDEFAAPPGYSRLRWQMGHEQSRMDRTTPGQPTSMPVPWEDGQEVWRYQVVFNFIIVEDTIGA